MTPLTLSSATPPPFRLVVLAIQHVLVMYAGAVAVPLILGAALKLPRYQVALLINADLFACGIATFIQAFGVGPAGIRLPVMMGVAFALLPPMLATAGIRILASVDYEGRRGNVFVVAISIGFGMIPLVAPTLFKSAPDMLKTMLDSGILLAAGAHDAPLVVAEHA